MLAAILKDDLQTVLRRLKDLSVRFCYNLNTFHVSGHEV